MVNKELLEIRIKKSGKTKTHLAKKIGRSIQSLKRKIDNKSDFTINEVGILCSELEIKELSEKEEIFFADNVE